MDIIQRASRLVDRLVIGVAINNDKKPLFSLEERVEMINEEVNHTMLDSGVQISIHPFESLLMDCAREVNATLIIRGLRAVSDFEYEFQMVGMNRILSEDIETVFLMADANYQSIASRLVKEIAILGGDTTKFVPNGIQKRLSQKTKSRLTF
jgi:pantetheine-phosphate adenylyltransferase